MLPQCYVELKFSKLLVNTYLPSTFQCKWLLKYILMFFNVKHEFFVFNKVENVSRLAYCIVWVILQSILYSCYYSLFHMTCIIYSDYY